MPKTEAVTTRKSTEVAPADLYAPEGFSLGIEQEDIQIPSLIILQALTELSELDDRSWKKGQLYNMGTDKVVDTLSGLIIGYYPTAILEGPKKDNGRRDIAKFSSDGKHWDDTGDLISPMEFQYKDNGSFAKKRYHYLVLEKGADFPVMVTFKGASAKYAKRLNSHLARMIPSWKFYFRFKTVQEESNDNKYFVLQAMPLPKVRPNDSEAKLAFSFYNSFNSRKIVNDEMAPTTESDPVY